MTHALKNLLAAVLILSLVLPSLAVPLRTAYAVPVTGGPVSVIRIFETPTSPEWLMTYILKPAARIVVRALLIAATNQIVAWIQGGGGSNVGFVKNYEKELRRQVDARAAEFLNHLTGINLCGNIGAFLRVSLRVPRQLREQVECTVTQIIANVEDFYQNFSNGGWPVFAEIAANPQNDPYGAYLLALDAKLATEISTRQRVEVGVSTGSGFLGFRVAKGEKCEPISRPTQDPTGGEAPGGIPIVTKHEEGTFCYTEYETRTPGQIIHDQLSKSLGTGIDFAISAKDFDEAIAVIITALINRLLFGSVGSGGGIFGDTAEEFVVPAEPTHQSTLVRQIDDALLRSDATISILEERIAGWETELRHLEEECAKAAREDETAVCDEGRIDELRGAIAEARRQLDELRSLREKLITTKIQMLGDIDPNVFTEQSIQLGALLARVDALIREIGGPPWGSSVSDDPKTNTIALITNAINRGNSALTAIDQKIATTSDPIEQNRLLSIRSDIEFLIFQLDRLRSQLSGTNDPTRVRQLTVEAMEKINQLGKKISEAGL